MHGRTVLGQSQDYQCYSGAQGYSDRGVVGYAWKDSPWTISWDTDSVTQMYGDNLTESIILYVRVVLGQSKDH